ncbi:MAG: hypothetical protein KGI37_09730 [Alphaproteobacteria bacterium]|nr:hypothetical protein [Alphaproteobacteria bacterium]
MPPRLGGYLVTDSDRSLATQILRINRQDAYAWRIRLGPAENELFAVNDRDQIIRHVAACALQAVAGTTRIKAGYFERDVADRASLPDVDQRIAKAYLTTTLVRVFAMTAAEQLMLPEGPHEPVACIANRHNAWDALLS